MGWDTYNAAGTKLVSPGQYDFLGTLVAPAIAITGTTTATISRMHYVTGTTADYTITLPPVSGLTGKSLAFAFGPTLTQLSKAITLDGDGTEKIGGIASKILWAGEACVLQCDGAGWQVLSYTANPMFAEMADSTTTTVTASTQSKIDTDVTARDNTGFLADTTNKRINIKRTGYYALTGIIFGQLANIAALMQTLVTVNGAVGAGPQAYANGGVNDYYGTPAGSGLQRLVAGDYVELYAGNYAAGDQAIGGSFSVSEHGSWAAF
jgi:hypothetical protein